MPSLQDLAALPQDHPCLWGQVALTDEAGWVLEPDARLVATRRTGHDGSEWWKTRKQGGRDRHGAAIDALTDWRGCRPIYPLTPQQQESPGPAPQSGARPTLLYGGTLFDHFGHLVLDLSRAYQLLRLFRNSNEPIWFHYPSRLHTPHNHPGEPAPPAGGAAKICTPLVLEWLHCLGLRKRTRLIRKNLHTSMLASSAVLYSDRRFVSRDFPEAARAALAPRLSRKLLKLESSPGRIAYLSRHKLSSGTTRFVGEEQVVAAIETHPRIDVICPEELSIVEKLSLFRRYPLIAGFPQACMNLKCFVPYGRVEELARQVMFIAGPKSLSSNWVNLDRACGFGDRLLDCSAAAGPEQPAAGFQRSNPFDPHLVVDSLRALAG